MRAVRDSEDFWRCGERDRGASARRSASVTRAAGKAPPKGWHQHLPAAWAFAGALAAGLGCGGRNHTFKPEPVAECQEYERALAKCTGHSFPISTQPAALASSEAQREQLRSLCLINLDRINAACQMASANAPGRPQ